MNRTDYTSKVADNYETIIIRVKTIMPPST